MDMVDVRRRLEEMADEKLRQFSESLTPGAKVMGIRIPQLRLLAKEIAKSEEWEETLRRMETDMMEERLLYGLVIGYAKLPTERKLRLIKGFVPLIDSWPVCDCACSTFKSLTKDLPATWEFIRPYFASEKEYELRFAVVMLMDYFITEEYIDHTLAILDSLRPAHYYSRMGVAWALSVCYAKFPEKTMEILKSSKLDKETYNKTLQKIRESRRVTEEDKRIVGAMRRQDD